jgi:two-component system, cell cycle sensor histidine kinase and response regulator CckA
MLSRTTAAFHGPRVVACHDDAATFALITRTLRDAGCRVFPAYDGFACYELALAIPSLELLVVNSRLGTMDGPTLIQHIRAELPHVAVLHVGPDPESRIPPDVRNLPEPFSADQLLAAVDHLLPPSGESPVPPH